MSVHKEKVEKKTKTLKSLIQAIEVKTKATTSSREIQEFKKATAKEQAKMIEMKKATADSALIDALPAVEAAANALNLIRREDLQELKAFQNPPIHVKIVCQMCVVLRPTNEILDETWADAKKLLSHPKLLDSLKSYPKEQMTERMYQQCKKILNVNKAHDISIETMATKSQAGKGLLVWVFAILRYYEMVKNVTPLRLKVKQMQEEKSKTEMELQELEENLRCLNIDVSNLQSSYDEACIDLSELQLRASEMESQLLRSSHLIQSLNDENKRWKEELDRSNQDRSQLLGDHLIGAAYLSYFGVFDMNFRNELKEKLLKNLLHQHLPHSKKFRLEKIALTLPELQCWNNNGLPIDTYSTENGILVMHSNTYPFCIDPQGQAATWIKKMFEKSNLFVHTETDEKYMKQLQIAVEFGYPFLFENVSQDIDSKLDNLLDIPLRSNQETVLLSDKRINWNRNFRLFFCTRLENPSFVSRVIDKLHLINFSLSSEGLSEQLLNIVVLHEKPVSLICFNFYKTHSSFFININFVKGTGGGV